MCFGNRKTTDAPLSWRELKRIMDTYHVEAEEVDKCWALFQAMDASGGGVLGRADLFRAVEQPTSYLLHYFFDAIGFREDVLLKLDVLFDPLFAFLTLRRSQVHRILFDQLDVEGTGSIGNDELHHRVCKILQVEAFAEIDEKIQACVVDADADRNGQIVFSEFVVLVGKLPRLLHPVFQTQAALQEFTLGRKVWVKKVEAAVLAERAREAELATLRRKAALLEAGLEDDEAQAPAVILDDSLDTLSNPEQEKREMKKKDKTIGTGNGDARGDGDRAGEPAAAEEEEEEEEGTKSWRQRERDRAAAEAKALGGQWKARGDSDDDDDEEAEEKGAGGSKVRKQRGGKKAAVVAAAALAAAMVASKAKAQLQSMFARASKATEEFLGRSVFATRPNEDADAREARDMRDISLDATGDDADDDEERSELLRKLAVRRGVRQPKNPGAVLDKLFAEARQAVGAQAKTAKRKAAVERDRRRAGGRRSGGGAGAAGAAGIERQRRELRRLAHQRRQKLLSRVQDDLHARDVKAGLVPDDGGDLRPGDPGGGGGGSSHSRFRGEPASEKVSPQLSSARPQLPTRGRRRGRRSAGPASTVASMRGRRRAGRGAGPPSLRAASPSPSSSPQPHDQRAARPQAMTQEARESSSTVAAEPLGAQQQWEREQQRQQQHHHEATAAATTATLTLAQRRVPDVVPERALSPDTPGGGECDVDAVVGELAVAGGKVPEPAKRQHCHHHHRPHGGDANGGSAELHQQLTDLKQQLFAEQPGDDYVGEPSAPKHAEQQAELRWQQQQQPQQRRRQQPQQQQQLFVDFEPAKLLVQYGPFASAGAQSF